MYPSIPCERTKTMDEMDCKKMRKQKIRDAKTGLILDAALEVLSQKGYYETRLEDIAEKAGFSKSALYRYYKDKDEIFFTIAVRERNKVIDMLTKDPGCRLSPENHISVNLRHFLTAAFTAWGKNFSFILALNSFQVFSLVDHLEGQDELEEIEKDFLTGEDRLSDLMTELFDTARGKGEIATELNSELLFDFFQGLIFTKIKKWHQRKKMGNIDEAVDQIVTFLAKGFGYEYEN